MDHRERITFEPGHRGGKPCVRGTQTTVNAVWKKGDLEPTAEAFRRLLWLDPHDNLGARFNLATVEAGRRWEDVRDEDGPGPYG